MKTHALLSLLVLASVACDNGPKTSSKIKIEGVPVCAFDEAKKSPNRLKQPLKLMLAQGSDNSSTLYSGFTDGVNDVAASHTLGVFDGGTFKLTVERCDEVPANDPNIACSNPTQVAEQDVEIKKGETSSVTLSKAIEGACIY